MLMPRQPVLLLLLPQLGHPRHALIPRQSAPPPLLPQLGPRHPRWRMLMPRQSAHLPLAVLKYPRQVLIPRQSACVPLLPQPGSQAPQADSTDAQAVSTSPASTQASTDGQASSAVPGPPMTTHWKIPTINGSSTCLANL